MTGIFAWFLSLVLFPPEEREMSERLAPPGFEGNYWGPEATDARQEGKLPPIPMTPHMARWDRWGARCSATAISSFAWATPACCTATSQ